VGSEDPVDGGTIAFNTKNSIVYRGDDIRLTKWVAYEIGVHIGDGNMYSYGRTHRVTYCGNLKNEKKFYKEFLLKILEKNLQN